MAGHHREAVSVFCLITRLLLYLCRYIRFSGRRPVWEQRLRERALFVLIPLSPDEERYWCVIAIASDGVWPWSPKEVIDRVFRVYQRFCRWVRGVLGPGAFSYIEGGTILYVGAVSRGCYAMSYAEWDHNVRLMIRDARALVRWLRSWNPRRVREVFGDFEQAMREFMRRAAREVAFFFRALAGLFREKAEMLERSSLSKDVRPYGPLKTRIETLRILSETLSTVVAVWMRG